MSWRDRLTPDDFAAEFEWAFETASGALHKDQPEPTDVFRIWKRSHRAKVKCMSEAVQMHGYPTTGIGQGFRIPVHHVTHVLLLKVFCPPGLVIDHVDRNRENFDPRNLRCVTLSCNAKHKTVLPARRNRRAAWQTKRQHKGKIIPGSYRDFPDRAYGGRQAAYEACQRFIAEWDAAHPITAPTIWDQYALQNHGTALPVRVPTAPRRQKEQALQLTLWGL